MNKLNKKVFVGQPNRPVLTHSKVACFETNLTRYTTRLNRPCVPPLIIVSLTFLVVYCFALKKFLVICRKTIKSFIQGFLPGIALKIFLILLPTILMIMSKFEGFLSISRLERRSASRYYLFNFVNVFLASVIAGTVLEQLHTFLKQSVNK